MKKYIALMLICCLILSGCSDSSYSDGYDQGYKDGFSDGDSNGYERGYEVGQDDYEYDNPSYDEGYHDALMDFREELLDFGASGYSVGYYDGLYSSEYVKETDYDLVYDYGIYDDYSDGFITGYEDRIDRISQEKELDYTDIPMIKVESDFIDAIGYSCNDESLLIQMNGKDLYRYNNVDEEEFTLMLSADSAGTYFNQYIKDMYDYEKLE